MNVLRFLASLFLLVAMVALVSDLSPWLQGARPYAATSFAKHWGDLAPATLQSARTSLSRVAGPWVWDWIVAGVISLPTSYLFGFLAALCGWAGRRRRRVDVFVN